MQRASAAQPVRRFVWPRKLSRDLAAEMRSAFLEDGFLICDGFASEKECAELKDQADKLIDAFDEHQHQVVFSASGQSHASSEYFLESAGKISCFLEAGAVDENGQLTKPKQSAINKIGHALHDLDPVYSVFSRQQKCQEIVAALGTQSPVLVQSMVICKQPFIGAEVNSHQDSTFLHTSPESCIGLWLALEPATKSNGCMWAAKGGHHLPLKSRFHQTDKQMVMSQLHDQELGECDTPLEAATGTLVVLHGRLPHLSHENKSSSSRYAYALHLVDGECDYSADNWLQRPADFPVRGF